MAGCLKSLFCWRKKKAETVLETNEKPWHNERGFPTRSEEKPAYFAVSTALSHPAWALSAEDGAKLKEEGAGGPGEAEDPVEAERRRKAEEDEQERLNFFQML